MTHTEDYLVPPILEPGLAQVRDYWEGLKRGGNNIPFWDDVKISQGAPLAREMMLIEVFDDPQRFRFDIVGDDIAMRYGGAFAGKFADEMDIRDPLDKIAAQCRTTIARRAPTYHRSISNDKGPVSRTYSRLIVPLWGNGRIEMLLGAVTP